MHMLTFRKENLMKKLIIIILMMLLIPISYVSAEDKETVYTAEDKTLMLLKRYLPLVANYNYVFYQGRMTKEKEMAVCFDCIEEQKRIIGSGRMGAGGKITNPLNEYKNKKIYTSPFSWIFIPDIKEGQPAGMVRFSYSF